MQHNEKFNKFLICRASALLLSVGALLQLSGCGSILNTAGSAEYGCPGMPQGVLCKTPAAVYRSTHGEVAPTHFDTPIGAALPATQSEASNNGSSSATAERIGMGMPGMSSKVVSGPRPVREPPKVARIWIAPWVDKNDNLHLSQVQFTEIRPRTWTVGKPEVGAGSGYVIPHRAYESIEPLKAASISAPVPSQSKAMEEAKSLVIPQ